MRTTLGRSAAYAAPEARSAKAAARMRLMVRLPGVRSSDCPVRERSVKGLDISDSLSLSWSSCTSRFAPGRRSPAMTISHDVVLWCLLLAPGQVPDNPPKPDADKELKAARME